MSPGPQAILAATDLSTGGRLAVVRAASVARATGADLHVVHVCESDDGDDDAARDAVERDVRRHVGRIEPRPQIHLRTGSAFGEVIDLARTLDVELIVAGAHSHDRSRPSFLGTTAARLARHGDRLLLLVRRPIHGPYRRVLVGMDGSPPAANALQAAHSIAPTATLVAVLAFTIPGERKLRSAGIRGRALVELRDQVAQDRHDDLAGYLEAAPTPEGAVEAVAVDGPPEEALCSTAAQQRCDVIAVGTHGRTGLRQVLLGSVAERVLRDADCDVLVAHHEDVRFENP